MRMGDSVEGIQLFDGDRLEEGQAACIVATRISTTLLWWLIITTIVISGMMPLIDLVRSRWIASPMASIIVVIFSGSELRRRENPIERHWFHIGHHPFQDFVGADLV